jgi:hypothetical protein
LIGDGPALLVYIGGIVACAMLWRRAPFAAMLAMIGLSLMLFALLAGALFSNYMVTNRAAMSSMGSMMSAAFFVFSIVRAVGVGLILAGVFAQRRVDDRGFSVDTYPANPYQQNQ